MERFPRNTVVPRFDHAGLVALLTSMADGSLPEIEVDRRLLTFCLNCPDPAGAMNVFLDAERGTTDTAIVAAALSLPARLVATVPVNELSAEHPLRHWRVGE